MWRVKKPRDQKLHYNHQELQYCSPKLDTKKVPNNEQQQNKIAPNLENWRSKITNFAATVHDRKTEVVDHQIQLFQFLIKYWDEYNMLSKNQLNRTRNEVGIAIWSWLLGLNFDCEKLLFFSLFGCWKNSLCIWK